uniref:Neural proliferation, differentiation and control, 1b n=1 Tax=Sphaeramia orbicularis TaxID=375764 RepID=A0A672YKH1_9TELE
MFLLQKLNTWCPNEWTFFVTPQKIGSHLCPRSLDCARAGRHFCQQGSSHCGPCLRPLVENSHGRCVIKRRHLSHSTQSAKGKISPYPELDEELDILSAIISEQRTETRLPGTTVTHLSHTEFRTHAVQSVSSADVTECKLKPLSCPLLPLTVFQPGDKKLAHSAQMYHYQHQKQQMLSLEKHREGPKVPDSGASTDEENEDGDFTVYECPGLAPTGEMEVKNPLFDDSTLYFQRFHK